MTRAVVSALLAVGLVASVHADATLKQTAEGRGAGLSGSSPATICVLRRPATR